jgi:divalent metal cation (Fe/Co/Zn/Cd) transporter
MKAFWKYTLARVGLFLVAYVVIWAAANAVRSGQPALDPFILLAAIIISGALSIFLLRGMREEVASQVANRTGRTTRGVQANRDADDLD